MNKNIHFIANCYNVRLVVRIRQSLMGIENRQLIYKIKTSVNTGVNQNIGNPSESDKKEQERTRIKKELFISFYKKLLGSIDATAEMAGINNDTYYDWMKKDPIFNRRIRECVNDKLNKVEQQMNKKILEGDSTMIRYFLDRKHPGYMPKIKVVAPLAGEKSIEDLIVEGEWRDTNEVYDNEETIEQQNDNREALQNKEQKGENGSVCIESGAAILLDEKNEEKSGAQV